MAPFEHRGDDRAEHKPEGKQDHGARRAANGIVRSADGQRSVPVSVVSSGRMPFSKMTLAESADTGLIKAAAGFRDFPEAGLIETALHGLAALVARRNPRRHPSTFERNERALSGTNAHGENAHAFFAWLCGRPRCRRRPVPRRRSG